MSFTVTCYTLFDITQTGVVNRNKPVQDEDPMQWLYKRNTQCNFDTILQVISLRSQPEILTSPIKSNLKFEEFTNFGFLFDDAEEHPYWSFDFSIQHPSVFDNGITELGSLYADCEGVPMIKCGTEWSKLPAHLDSSDEQRNIYFK